MHIHRIIVTNDRDESAVYLLQSQSVALFHLSFFVVFGEVVRNGIVASRCNLYDNIRF